MEFFIQNVAEEDVRGREVLEVGSKYVNGSARPYVERLKPKRYIGVDIQHGKYVDIILSAERLVEYFGETSVDVVIASELLEHVRDWRSAVENMKRVLRPGGILYVTTRSYGFGVHAHPYDFWRYEMADIKTIFSDFLIEVLEKDPHAPGVFVKAFKPDHAKPSDLGSIDLYSMILGKRTMSIPEITDMPYPRRLKIWLNGVLGRCATRVSVMFPAL